MGGVPARPGLSPFCNAHARPPTMVTRLARATCPLTLACGAHENVGKIQETVQTLTCNLKVSSLKGQIGENFVSRTINEYFPDDSLNITAHESQESDMHFISGNFKILIETKLYSTAVNTRQIDKFYRDLERTGFQYGIFISLSMIFIIYKTF